MTDQYINQRIIGIGTPTWGTLQVCQRPCWVCTKHWLDDGYDCGYDRRCAGDPGAHDAGG